MLGQRLLFAARRPEQIGQLRRIQITHARFAVLPLVFDSFSMMAKIIQIQTEGAVFLKFNDPPHLMQQTRLAVGRKPHDLVFIAVIRKTKVLRQRLIKDAEGMREIDFVLHLDRRATPDPPGRAGEIAKTIHRHRDRFFERRHQKRRSQVRQMVLNMSHLRAQRFARKCPRQFSRHPGTLTLVANPVEHQRQVRPARGGVGQLLPQIGAGVLIDGDYIQAG